MATPENDRDYFLSMEIVKDSPREDKSPIIYLATLILFNRYFLVLISRIIILFNL